MAENMSSRIAELVSQCSTDPCDDEREIESVKSYFGFAFPGDYLQFMREYGGTEGFVGRESYLILWPIRELITHNEGYKVKEFCPELVLIGSNGGGTAYAFDTSSREKSIVEIPFMDLGLSNVTIVGQSFLSFLEYLNVWN